MKKRKRKPMMTILFMIVVVLVVLGAFWQIRLSRSGDQETGVGNKGKGEVEKLLAIDLDVNYPGNAREVVKMYNRIMKCFYNETLAEDQLGGLALQLRQLFDTELLKRNPSDEYLSNLKSDIEGYKAAKRTISNVKLQDYEEVDFETRGEYETASLLSYYLMKEDGKNVKTYLRYYLREDEEGKWRILFWEVSDETF